MSTVPADQPRRSRARRKPPGVYHHGDLRRSLLDATLALVRAEGPRGVSLRAAARRVGVSPAAPYRHFADREAMMAAVAEEGFRALEAALRAAAERGGADPVVRLQALGVEYVRFALARPSHYRVMFGAEIPDRAAHPALAAAADAAFAGLAAVVAEGQRAGKLRAGDAAELARVCWALVHGLADLLVAGQLGGTARAPEEVDRLARRMTATLLEGLAVGRGAGSGAGR